jgi:hypothetical protein
MKNKTATKLLICVISTKLNWLLAILIFYCLKKRVSFQEKRFHGVHDGNRALRAPEQV